MHAQMNAAKSHKNVSRKTRIAVAVLLSAASLLLMLKYGLAPLLTTAARENDTDRALLLLRLGAYCDYKDAYDTAPLHYAACNGNIKLVSALIERGADIHIEAQGITSIEFAAFNGYQDVVCYLINNGANSDKVLENAVGGNKIQLVEWLLTNNLYKIDINRTNENGVNVLWRAASNGQSTIVKLLLTAGVDINCTNNYRKLSTLQIAAENGHTDVVAVIHHYTTNQFSK